MFQTNLWRKARGIKFNIFFSFFENHALYEIMWTNFVQPGRPQMTIWRMRISCWVTKATNIHSEYVIIIVFILQQWLYAHFSMLGYTYIACIVH